MKACLNLTQHKTSFSDVGCFPVLCSFLNLLVTLNFAETTPPHLVVQEIHRPLLSPWYAGQHVVQASAKHRGLGAWFRAGKGAQSEAIGANFKIS